jgi:hypothetical protein
MSDSIVSVNGQDVPIIYYRGQRVITLAQIDDLHGKKSGTAGRFFRLNRHRLIKDQEYFRVSADDQIGMSFRFDSGADDQMGLKDTFDLTARRGKPLILLTEPAYCLIAKPYNDDRAWDVQRQLVDGYFRAAEQKSRANLSSWLCFNPRRRVR